MKFLTGLWYDTIGQEDKAKAILGLDTLEKKKAYWLKVALLCGVAGLALAPFTYGISLALLLVSARKMQMYYTKKEEAPKLGLMGMDIAMKPVEGTYTWEAAVKWRLRVLASHVRTSWKYLLGVGLAAAALAGVAITAINHRTTAPATICECPLKQQPAVQGEKQSEPSVVTKQKSKTEKK